MHLLYYWKRANYKADMQRRDWFHLNQGAPAMSKVKSGESLWAFTRNGTDHYVLAAELRVSGAGLNNPFWTERYGRYRVWGGLANSAYFDVARSPDVEPLLRTLSVSARGKSLGGCFQGHAAVRPLLPSDHARLAEFAAGLPLDRRVHLEGVRALTQRLGQQELYAELDLFVPQTQVAEGVYQLSFRRARNPELVQQLQDLYKGRCQICLWDPHQQYQRGVCEAHHIQWLSCGGPDQLENMALLCPNHHRAAHACDAVLDFEDLVWRFGERREALRLNEHLRRAV